jgi:hypothetical protein
MCPTGGLLEEHTLWLECLSLQTPVLKPSDPGDGVRSGPLGGVRPRWNPLMEPSHEQISAACHITVRRLHKPEKQVLPTHQYF